MVALFRPPNVTENGPVPVVIIAPGNGLKPGPFTTLSAVVGLPVVLYTTPLWIIGSLPTSVRSPPITALEGVIVLVAGAVVVTAGGVVKVKPAILAIPPVAVTDKLPLAPALTTAVIVVEFTTVKDVAATPPKLTAVAPVRFAPVIVTVSPVAAVLGEKDVIVGGVK